MDSKNHKRLWTKKRIVDEYGFAPGTIDSWVSRKQIPHVRLGPRMVRFDPDEIRAWIDARRIPEVA